MSPHLLPYPPVSRGAKSPKDPLSFFIVITLVLIASPAFFGLMGRLSLPVGFWVLFFRWLTQRVHTPTHQPQTSSVVNMSYEAIAKAITDLKVRSLPSFMLWHVSFVRPFSPLSLVRLSFFK